MLATRLLAGHGYSFADYWYPFAPPNTPTAHWSFLYTAFLAGVYAIFGPHPLAARLVQAVLGGLLLPWLTYRLTRRLFFGDHTAAKGEALRSGFLIPPWLPLLTAFCSAVYAYFIQRELCGLRRHHDVIREYRIPAEVLVRLGAS